MSNIYQINRMVLFLSLLCVLVIVFDLVFLLGLCVLVLCVFVHDFVLFMPMSLCSFVCVPYGRGMHFCEAGMRVADPPTHLPAIQPGKALAHKELSPAASYKTWL